MMILLNLKQIKSVRRVAQVAERMLTP